MDPAASYAFGIAALLVAGAAVVFVGAMLNLRNSRRLYEELRQRTPSPVIAERVIDSVQTLAEAVVHFPPPTLVQARIVAAWNEVGRVADEMTWEPGQGEGWALHRKEQA